MDIGGGGFEGAVFDISYNAKTLSLQIPQEGLDARLQPRGLVQCFRAGALNSVILLAAFEQ